MVILALIGAVVAVLGLQGKHLRPGIRVNVEMDRTGALKEGALVKISGRVVGSVDGIRLESRRGEHSADPNDPTEQRAAVVLDVWIDKRYAWMARENSEFFLNQVGILGEAYLEIGPPHGPDGKPLDAEPGPPITNGSFVRGIDPPRMDRLAQISYQNLVAVTRMFREGVPEARILGRNLAALADNLDAIAALDPEASTRLWAARARLWAEALAAWSEIEASGVGTSPEKLRATISLARIALDDARRDLTYIRDRIEPLRLNIAALQLRLAPARFARFTQILDDVDKLTVRVDAILATVDSLASWVAAGRGTIGAFLNDDEIADDFKEMTRQLKRKPWETVGHPQ